MTDENARAPLVDANGASIPALGFGTWQLKGDVARTAVEAALQAGYRHIDTAQIYGNERDVGQGLKAAALPRDEMFVTTKVWIENYRDADLKASVATSLEKLGLDHVDLLLLHWPNPDVPLAETMAALNAVREQGLTRHIGVSNFTTRWLKDATPLSAAPLVTNQVEYHPFLDQQPVKAALEAAGMALTAYSPIAQGKVADEPTIVAIAEAHGKTPGQVTLRWLIQQDGVIAIPRSSNPRRIAENFGVFDFELSDEEMGRISALGSREGRITSPSFAPDWD